MLFIPMASEIKVLEVSLIWGIICDAAHCLNSGGPTNVLLCLRVHNKYSVTLVTKFSIPTGDEVKPGLQF